MRSHTVQHAWQHETVYDGLARSQVSEQFTVGDARMLLACLRGGEHVRGVDVLVGEVDGGARTRGCTQREGPRRGRRRRDEGTDTRAPTRVCE
jgi:hypothetical protein